MEIIKMEKENLYLGGMIICFMLFLISAFTVIMTNQQLKVMRAQAIELHYATFQTNGLDVKFIWNDPKETTTVKSPTNL